MALPDRQSQAVIAANRFGLGARPGELDMAAGDPRGWLEAQLDAPPALQEGMPRGDALLADYLRLATEQAMAAKAFQNDPMGKRPAPASKFSGETYLAEVTARTRAAVTSAAPLGERLTWFWANHFTVSSATVPSVNPIAGAFEREAIRPHVFGAFADMLLASTRHPAMLIYLDNVGSVGPDSAVGKKTRRGLNENLGREILELHTLGVTGGYSQRDVTTFAKALTGWSVDRDRDGSPGDGGYRYDAGSHEPGAKTILGNTYPEDGEGEVLAVLRDLAAHPATANHVATKLARHFIADEPPESAVERLSRVFLDTGGDLGEVTRALIRMDEPWTAVGKIKSPYELLVSALRGLDMEMPAAPALVGSLSTLGQRPFSAPAPTGWPDTADDWAGPYALSRRIEWAARLAGAAKQDGPAADALARSMLGGSASALLIESLQRAKDRPQALSLLLASPGFQRR
jgi:uncharacterized protein (DUF1800 family)